ncbi:protein translocase subunit SecF [Halococcus saccharolyticus]|uniref:Protein-export membrane protein SecF n=1 Tax=Halococcus saccharolyticus DSM 5350 TaxID=1227455 RepID=M0MFC7_9EURY|nr:protein translocase subunit SecF [Halococcus saccharolyticus]EMA43125.1 preprotein translocase subunit SecF [Halococcus saccharolyticus DSM 5350]
MVAFDVPDVEYTRYSNRQLAAIPLAVLALALAVLAGWYIMTGAPVTPGIAFTGGSEIQIVTDDSQAAIEDAFPTEPESVRAVRGEGSYIVTFQSTDTDAIRQSADQAGYEVESVQGTSATFGSRTQQLGLLGLGVAFVGMALLVFAMFRTFVPSIAVVLSAFSDIVIPLALMNVFGIKLSLGTVAALLMLIGYSVDSDILLNNHILRRRGDFYESTYRAMRTGVTMTLTSLSAMAVMAIVATYFDIPLLPEIGTVLVFGLTADLMNTYLMNVSLLRWYKYEGVAR